jgi:hypothetical protein
MAVGFTAPGKAGLVTVSISEAQRAELADVLAGVKNGAAKASAAAINRTLTTGRSRIVRRVRAEVNIKAKDAREAVRIRKATAAGTPEGFIVLSKRPIPLYDFGAKPGKRGVSVKVRKRAGREVLRGTFVAAMRSGHKGVFERKLVGGPGGRRVGRLPIVERHGPSLLGVFTGAPGVAAEELAAIGDVLQKNLASQVDRLLGRKRGSPVDPPADPAPPGDA